MTRKKDIQPLKLFLSYSHVDESFKNEFDRHLIMLKKSNIIQTWSDREMLPGDEFDEEISKHLTSSHIIILLVSVDYLNSSYCYEREMGKAIQRHNKGEALVISIILSSCDWKETSFSKYLVLPKDGIPIDMWPNKNEVYVSIIDEIKKVIKEFAESPKFNESPKLKKSNGGRKTGIKIELPVNHTAWVGSGFLLEAKMQYKNLYNFTMMSTKMLYEVKSEYKEYKKSIKPNEYLAWDYICMEIFFRQLCRYISICLFNTYGVRVHVRYLDNDKLYKKLVAIYEELEYIEDIKPMPCDNGMIYNSAKYKCSLIKSINPPEFHEGGNNDKQWKDYITMTFEDYFIGNNAFISLGISLEKPEKMKNTMFILNYCQFEKVIQDIIKKFEEICEINVINTIKKYCFKK